jgi:hypothetical protein
MEFIDVRAEALRAQGRDAMQARFKSAAIFHVQEQS